MNLFVIMLALMLAVSLIHLWTRQVAYRREAYIRAYNLPPGLFERLRKRRPDLTAKDYQLVATALRQFFLTHLKSGRRFVSMPSQIADDLWHEFILYTKNYDVFCRQAFGQFLHHTPAAVLSSNRLSNTGLRRCFWFACRDEHIDPRKPERLPLLFAIDGKLGIADGFHYAPNCLALRRAQADASGSPVYCGGDFSNSSFDGSTDGFGDSSGDSSGDGGGDSGGDSGCGGGGD